MQEVLSHPNFPEDDWNGPSDLSSHVDTEQDLAALELYIDAARRTSLLTPEQEVELAKCIQAGTVAEQELQADDSDQAELQRLLELQRAGYEARERFISANLRLVIDTALNYYDPHLQLLDIIQEGNKGLIKAVEKFDYTRGYKFSTYATRLIRGAISQAITQTSRPIRIPDKKIAKIRRLKLVQGHLTTEKGREPTIAEQAAAMDMSVEAVEALQTYANPVGSLDANLKEHRHGLTFYDVIPDGQPSPEQQAVGTIEQSELNDAIDLVLDDRPARIIRKRFGLFDGSPWSREDIGILEGVSRRRIQQIEEKAVQQLMGVMDIPDADSTVEISDTDSVEIDPNQGYELVPDEERRRALARYMFDQDVLWSSAEIKRLAPAVLGLNPDYFSREDEQTGGAHA